MTRHYPRLAQFRLSLMKILLLVAAFFSIFVAILAWFSFFPLADPYRMILLGYGGLNLLGYFLLQKDASRYQWVVYVSIIGSLVTFAVMTYSVKEDEFRLVWFFLTAFSAYILGGKRFGFGMTLMIVLLLLWLYDRYDLALSPYAIFTFLCALVVFNVFAYAFLKKIENDEHFFQQRVEEEVEARHSQEAFLLRQYRMASMGEMIDAIAHQWRQPLMQSNMIISNIQEELEEREEPDAYVYTKTQELVQLNRHMSHTIDDFRKILSSEKASNCFGVKKCVEEVTALMKRSLAGIDVQIEGEDVEVCTYKNELIQVLIILFSNALEALRVRQIADACLVCRIVREETLLAIEVEDNAGGIRSEVLERVFDPYFTTKEHTGGTGLGLYIAKLIMEKSIGGGIVCSNAAQGAKFTVRIPYA